MYATLNDLIERYSHETLRQITDKENVGAINEILVDRQLEEAGSIIDSKLRARYTLPLGFVPPEIITYCCWIARRLLEPDASDNVVRDYKEALDRLNDIASGKTILAGNEPKEAPAASIGGFETSPRQFTRESMEGF